ncbi:MAG: Cu2+-exporting ATPase [Rickettsiales bacterium]|jgi:Cu2+-exporting ATPase
MTNPCLHCNLPTSSSQEEFCCNGCSAAYKIINNLGFANYYKTRLLDPKTKPLKPEEDFQINLGSFAVQNFPNHFSINLMIEGLHCAACVWLIENVLKSLSSTKNVARPTYSGSPDSPSVSARAVVKKARINMSTKKLYLEWEGSREDGNKLVKSIFDLGYRLVPFDAKILKNQEKKYDSSLLKALAVAAFAAGNVMMISVALWASDSVQMGVATRNMLYWVSSLIALPAIIYSGRIFVISALKSLKAKRANMDFPIAVAIVLVSVLSVFEAIFKGEHAYFDSVIMLIFFLLIGRYLDFSARKKAFGIVGDLLLLSGTSATIIENGKHKIIASKDLKKEMILNVAMGEKIAADGIIISGMSEIDTSVITGESIPRKCANGDEVFAGTINLGDAIQVKITKSKDQTLLAKIAAMVENIENSKNHYTKISDNVARFYTPIIHLVAFLTFMIWCFGFGLGWHAALINATAVLIISCPCALALAVPVAQIVSAGRLLKQGILIKNGEALEKLHKVDVIVFDKTGTLTIGKPKLSNVSQYLRDPALDVESCKLPDGKNGDLMKIAASMAVKSKHILSQALAMEFQGELLDLEVREIVGQGLVANFEGEEVRLGNLEFVDCSDEQNSAAINQKQSEIDLDDNPRIYLKYQNKITIFNFQDTLRADAVQTIKKLKKYQNIILSGDRKLVVESVSKALGIKEYYFEKTPDQKLQFLQKLKKEGKTILMVGDGINDAPSLRLADISISPASASDISKNIADIVFQGEKLDPILQILKTAKKSNRIIKQNLGFALLYNCVAIPFAMMGFIVPLIAALAMSFSSIIVVTNALRIRKN